MYRGTEVARKANVHFRGDRETETYGEMGRVKYKFRVIHTLTEMERKKERRRVREKGKERNTKKEIDRRQNDKESLKKYIERDKVRNTELGKER